MSDYSGFKIKRPHSLAPLTSVYEAVAVDGRPGRFALKIFHPPASTNVRRFYAIEGWLLAAERQQLAAKKDGTVVEVLVCGRCAEGAFAIMPWQERFLEPWIKTLGAKGDTLRALATCLLNTIEAWEKETGGPHGNLKPANIFLGRDGPLVGMTAKLSDPAFMPGAKTEALRLSDLNAVGAILATIVRRRPPGAWPIEEAPEWKGLGNAGKGWLDFCNYLLNPQPNEGEVTLANARLRLKKVPKDANPVKTAILSLAAVLVLSAVSIVGFARFGNYNSMPEQVQRLAQTLNNPTVPKDIPAAWTQLCKDWDTWLVDMQSNADRLLRTDGLLDPNDPLRKALADFNTEAKNLRPEILVPEAASEKRLGVLGSSPPDAVFKELLVDTVVAKVQAAGKIILDLNTQLENWQRWDQLRALQKLMNDDGFTQAAGKLASRLPPARGSADYGKQNVVRTLKFFNDISLDDTGTLPLASRWSEITRLKTEMEDSGKKGDRIQKDMPEIILSRLLDKSSLSDFADSLVSPLEEMTLHRKQFMDNQVVRARFLNESELLKGTEKATAEDFPKWEQELVAFSKVPKAEDPRFAPDMATIAGPPPATAVDLEAQAPAGETGYPETLSKPDFENELGGVQANLKTLQAPEIVRHDLPKVSEDKSKLAESFKYLLKRLDYTLTLLKPDTWLAKAKLPYGNFIETKQRWEAWKQAERLNDVTADQLTGKANRARFLGLRANGRLVKDWIDGVEGPTGFGALKVPDLAGTASPATATELKRLEAVLRENAVKAVAAVAEWRNALPVLPWDKASVKVRDPLDKHSLWLGQMAYFASNLDQLSEKLTDGFGWTEGVHEMVVLLAPRPGVDDLKGKPAEWWAETKQLEKLEDTRDRDGLKAAAQSGGLSRKLTAWRRLSTVAGWPSGAADFDFDQGVVTVMRGIIKKDVKVEARRTSLYDEMVKVTRDRFNVAARSAARAEAQLTDMFNRLQKAGLTEKDLDDPVAYNLALWRLKGYDKNEKNLDRLRTVRDTFVSSVKAIGGGGIVAQPAVGDLLTELASLELKDDPNRVPTPSPGTVGWQEEPTNEGLAMTATWKSGARNVRLEYSVVQPADDTPPFYLANRVIAVGEFLDLMNGRPKDMEVVKEALLDWAKKDSAAKPYDVPVGWYPRSGTDCKVFELNSAWIYAPTSLVQGLLNNTELYATVPQLKQAVVETPTVKSPLQQVTPDAAKLFTEKMLGARLPTVKEWRAVLQVTGTTVATGHFRGPNFQKLFDFIKSYKVEGVKDGTLDWRPSTGIFLPSRNFKDDGHASANADESHLWFRPVDDGPPAGPFINLTGNISIFLVGDTPKDFYVAGGSALSPPGIDFIQPQKIVAGGGLIGGTAGKSAYSDVGIRPAFDAPPGFKEWYKLLVLVRRQKYLTL